MNKMFALVKFHFLTSLQSVASKRKKKKDEGLGRVGSDESSIASRMFRYLIGIFFGFAYVAIVLSIQGYKTSALMLSQGIYAESLTFTLVGIFMMSTIYGLLIYVSVMYYDKKADYLAILPVSSSKIFWSKFIFLYFNQLPIDIILFLPLCYASAAGAKLGAVSYVILTFIPFLTPILSFFLSTIISLPMNVIVSKVKRKSLTKNIYLGVVGVIFFIPLVVLLATSSVNEGNIPSNLQNFSASLMKGVANVAYPIYSFVKASTFAKGSGLMILYTLIIFVAITLITLFLSKFMYSKVTGNLDDSSIQRKIKKEKTEKSKLRVLVNREEQRLLKLPGASINLLIGLIMPFFFIIPVIISPIKEFGISGLYKAALNAKFTNTVSGPSMAMFFFGISMTAVYSNMNFLIPISSEHRTGLDYLLSLPVSINELIKAKFITSLRIGSVMMIPILMFFLAISPIIKLAFVFLIINGLLVFFAMLLITFIVDLSKPYLDWTNIGEIKQKLRIQIPLLIGIGISILEMAIAMVLAIFTYKVMKSYWILYLVVTLFNIIVFLVPFLLFRKNFLKYANRLQV